MKFFTINDTRLIDLDRLVRMLPVRQGWAFFRFRNQGKYIKAMLDSWEVLNAHEINTAKRLAHFIGQGLIETGWLRYTEENLNYSRDALIATFSYYQENPDLARQHARKPELIANTVYGRHPTLGNTEPGDGWKYRGRGFIQLTGRDNYQKYSDVTGIDIVGDPDQLHRDHALSIEVAAGFWKHNGLNEYADQNNAAAVSRGVNRGNPQSRRKAHSEAERIHWTNLALGLMEEPDLVTIDPDAPMGNGSTGERVKKLQEDLTRLGYDVGTADGIFGRRTGHGVLAFQSDEGLEPTGIADKETVDAIEEALSDTRRNSEQAFEQYIQGAYNLQQT